MLWVTPVWEGLLQGLVINLLSFGPSFFTLIHTGIRDGKKHGLMVAFGIFMSEAVVASVLFFGLRPMFVNPYFQMVFTALAACALIFMGVRAILHRYTKFLRAMNVPVRSGTSMLRGFLFNLVNPFVILLWVSLISTVSLHYTADQPFHRELIMLNILCILLGYFGMDVMKVYLSHHIGRNLNHRVTFLINRYFGYILTAIGTYFIYHFLRLSGIL
jgi:threonine/homoserine/homoserine lactone efflux protein